MLYSVFLLVLSCVTFHGIHADIADISETLVYNNPKWLENRVIAMYTKEDAPAGSGEPSIEMDLTARTSDGTNATGRVEVILLEAISLDDIRSSDGVNFCCTQALLDGGGAEGCTSQDQVNSLLLGNDTDTYHESLSIEFKKENTVKFNNKKFIVHKTGEQILILSNCDASLPTIVVEGTGTWRNPFGYLPGRLYGFLQFYGIMSLVYLGIGFVWFIFNAYYWTEVVMVQNCITIVLAMCMAEMTTWYFHYKAFNDTGKINVTVAVIAIMITVSRQTLSRLLVLSVSLGWGVVRPTLGKNKARLAILGIIYWFCEVAFELVARYSQTSGSIPDRIRMFLALPVAVLNAIFYWWIFIALYRVTAQLEARRQESKLFLYRRFTHVLIFSLIVTVAFAIYKLYYLYSNSILLHWSQLWLLEVGFSFIIYTVILLAIALLWRPSQNSRRYAYAEVARGVEDDGEFGDLELDEGQQTKHHDPLGIGVEDDSDEDMGPPAAGRFTVDEGDDHMHQEDPLDDIVGVNSQPMTKLA